MKQILFIVLFVYLSIGFTWFWYQAIMHLKLHRQKLNKWAKFIGYPWAIFAMLTDITFNIVTGSILFLELPKEWLFTGRVSRHLKESTGWQKKLAVFFCKNLLDPFDPSGKHC